MFEVGKSYRLKGSTHGFILRCDFVGQDKSLFTNTTHVKGTVFDRELVATNNLFNHYEEVREPESCALKIVIIKHKKSGKLSCTSLDHKKSDDYIREHHFNYRDCQWEIIDIVPFTYTEKEK